MNSGLNNKQHEIFSEFFNMCSFPFCTCRSAERNVGREKDGCRRKKEEEGEGVNEGKGRASSRRRRERERTQLTVPRYSP